MRRALFSVTLFHAWSHVVAHADVLPTPGRPEFDDTPLPMPSEPELVALAALVLVLVLVLVVARNRQRTC